MQLNIYAARFQRSCTSHYVLGVEESVVFGRHYYSIDCIRRACWGIVHTFVLNVAVTNTEHNDTKPLVHRVMAYWYRQLIVMKDGFTSKL